MNILLNSLLFSPCVYLVLEPERKTNVVWRTLFVINLLAISLYLPFLFGATVNHFVEHKMNKNNTVNPINSTILHNFNKTVDTTTEVVTNKNCSFDNYGDFMTNECERLGVITIFTIIYFIQFIKT